MSTFAKKMRRLTAMSFTALIICAVLAATASAASVSWTTGGADLLWSTNTPSNWSTSPAVPAVGDDITFAAAGAVNTTATTNEVDANFTNSINSLWYSQQGDPSTTAEVHTTVIDPGVTLRITGSAALPTTPIAINGLNGNYSLMTGSYGSTVTTQNHTYISGDGTLDISANGGGVGTTSGDIIVRESQSGSSTGHTQPSILNMSGLANFTASVDQLLVGVNTTSSSGSGERPGGVLYLAKSSTITMNNTGTGVNTGLIVGYVNHNAGTTPVLYLGQTNVLNVDNVILGGKRSKGSMFFNPLMLTPTPSLKMRGSASTDLIPVRVASIVLGDNKDLTTTASTSDAIGVMDLRGGSADIQASSIILGRGPAATTTASSKGGNGTLYMNIGTIDTTSMVIGDQIANWNATHTGTANISGGTLNVSNPATGGGGGSFVLAFRDASVTSAGNGTSSGTLNITGGTVGLGCDITDGGGTPTLAATAMSTISLDNTSHTGTGTLDMGLGPMVGGVQTVVPHSIGTTTPIDSLIFGSGTLKNVAGINSAVDGTTMNKTTAGLLVLDGTNTYTGNTKVSAGTLKFAATVSIASSTIDVFAGTLDVTAFDGAGYTLASGKTLKGNGTVNGFVNVLGGTVSPGESPGTLNVGDMTFGSGSTLNIELNGTAAGLFDVLNSTGALALQSGSALAVSLGYTPIIGDSFDIMNWSSESGTFDTLSLPALPGGLTWDTGNLYTSGSIAVVPEPATLLMLIIAAGLCLVFKRARNK